MAHETEHVEEAIISRGCEALLQANVSDPVRRQTCHLLCLAAAQALHQQRCQPLHMIVNSHNESQIQSRGLHLLQASLKSTSVLARISVAASQSHVTTYTFCKNIKHLLCAAGHAFAARTTCVGIGRACSAQLEHLCQC